MNYFQELIKGRQYSTVIDLCNSVLAQKHLDVETEAEMLAVRGRCKWFKAMYGDAIEDQLSALEKLLEAKIDRRYGITLVELGMSYDALPDYSRAKDVFSKGYEFNKAHGYDELAATSLASLGLVYGRVGDHVTAVAHLSDADKLFEDANSYSMRAEFLARSIVSITEVRGEGEAILIARRAIEVALLSGRRTKLATAHRALAICEAKRGNWRDSLLEFQVAQSIYQQECADVEIARTSYDLAKSHYRYFELGLGDVGTIQSMIDTLGSARAVYSSRGYTRRAEMVQNLSREYYNIKVDYICRSAV